MIDIGSARRARAAGARSGTASAALVAAAVGGGLLAQGGYYPRAQWFIGLLLCAALLIAPGGLRLGSVRGRRGGRAGAGALEPGEDPGEDAAAGTAAGAGQGGVAQGGAEQGGVAQGGAEQGGAVAWQVPALALPGLAAAAFGGWAVADGALHGNVAAGARYAALAAGMLATLLVCSRLAGPAGEPLLAALLTTGTLLAALGWLGVVLHRAAWAWQGDGLWRASSSLTYPNATAAVLAVLALLCLALLIDRPRSVALGLTATALLAGFGATLSRAGVLGLVVGCGVLAAAAGPRALLRVGWAPALGAAVTLAGLVPSMSAASPTHPAVAVAALAAGLGIGAGLPAVLRSLRSMRPVRVAGRAPVLAVAAGAVVLPAVALAVLAPVRQGVRVVAGGRMTLDSPGRLDALRAAWQVVRQHPVAGTGPGHTPLTWVRPGGGVSVFAYAHNEYVQVLLELGVVGLVLVAALLAALFRVVWQAGRATPLRAAALAGGAALAVHSGLDFLWHLPAIPLLAAALVGLAAAEEPARLFVPSIRRGVPT